MPAIRFEYSENLVPKTVDFECWDAIRLVARTCRKQVIMQLENKKYLQYVLGYPYKEFSLTIDQTYENLEKLYQLKATRVPLTIYYKYNRYPSVYSTVMVDPNLSVSYASGHLAPGQINIRFIETDASIITSMLQLEVMVQ